MNRYLSLVLLLLSLSACAPQVTTAPVPTPVVVPVQRKSPALVAVDSDRCRQILRDDASPELLRRAAQRNLEMLRRMTVDRRFDALQRKVSRDELIIVSEHALIAANLPDPASYLCDALEMFRVDLPLKESSPVLFTGYYQPELRASRSASRRFRYPIYQRPHDVLRINLREFCSRCDRKVSYGRAENGEVIPYYTRAEIESGLLSDRDLAIAWLDDPVEAFFLHIQGSGLLRFSDGASMFIGYAGSNGRPYSSIGKVLVQQGAISSAHSGMEDIKAYLRTHPGELRSILNRNERYIFFRTVPMGPMGSAGMPLVNGRSIAADTRIYPPGSLAFLQVSGRSTPENSDDHGFSRLAFVQDTGTAIRGPDRIDVFWGSGESAGRIAGDLRNQGELYFLFPSSRSKPQSPINPLLLK